MLLKKFSREWLITEARDLVFKVFAAGWVLPPKQTVSQWADENRYLSPESAAEVGPWDTGRAEYQREMMDAISDVRVSKVTFMTSSQVGKTELINNGVGFIIDRDPGPIMLLQPSLELADTWSEDRLAPMVRDTKSLAGKVSDPASRSSENRKRRKSFPGGQITMAGANSAASLASRPIRYLLMDEIDRYPYAAGKEGDPVGLAEKRTTTFWNKKIVKASTPTIKGYSRIDKEFEESDKRYYNVPCPDCGEFQRLSWSNVKWEKDQPQTACYVCDCCGSVWNDVQRWGAVKKGKWIATKPFNGHAGFWLNEIYSTWVTLENMVGAFLEAHRKGPEALQVFVNTSLAECWEDEGERVDDMTLLNRREDYVSAPEDVVVITAGVDVQADRLEVELVGWCANESSYGLEKRKIHGDPTGQAVWDQLDDYLHQYYPHDLVGEMPIMATGIDAGYLTQQVGLFCRPRWGRRIWAVKGVAGPSRAVWEQSPQKLRKLNLKFFRVGVDVLKETLYTRLRIDDPEIPGYCHFTKAAGKGYDEEHFDQLTSEEVVTGFSKGLPVRHWKLKEGKRRNEALDIRNYATAALEGLRVMGLSLRRERDKMRKRAGVPAEPPQKKVLMPAMNTEHEAAQPRPRITLTQPRKKKSKSVRLI